MSRLRATTTRDASPPAPTDSPSGRERQCKRSNVAVQQISTGAYWSDHRSKLCIIPYSSDINGDVSNYQTLNM